ncbi:hypothetical protein R1sor_009949 [Riccia sorocarpa]|uniref:Reverse transcriptase domain-containing protein n=1 Tax=Riccia sorocarpa TaxID=122646 RepID=A0ABD3HWV4_9MARC
MAKQRSPGEDGVPVEVLVAAWDWIGDRCLKVLHTVWSDHSIMDNIVCAKLSQDYAEERQQPAIFCKLDFVKAFDRVQHEFLWDTLRSMHFSPEFIALVRTLVAEGSAKVHFNGVFTKSFKLTRGVRQGCPVSPLLITLHYITLTFHHYYSHHSATDANIPRCRKGRTIKRIQNTKWKASTA